MILDIMEEAADRLRSLPYFDDVPVITEAVKDFENKIQIAVAQLNVCVVIVAPSAPVLKGNVPGPYFDGITIVARVHENVTINQHTDGGAHKRALDVAENVMAALHGYRPNGVSESFVATEQGITMAHVPIPSILAYDCNLKTSGGLVNDIPTVATPTINIVAGVATIACATPGAVLVYSFGTYPSPRNANAVGPSAFFIASGGTVAVTPGQTLKVRAWLPGYNQSPIVTATAP